MAEFSEQSEELAPKPEELKPDGGPAPHPEEAEVAKEVAPEPEKKLIKLSEPSKELAIRLLGKVGLKDRITGVQMTPRGEDAEGAECLIFSLEEAVGFLKMYEKSLSERNDVIFFLNPNYLKEWVGETLGDQELAQAIEEKIRQGSRYGERVLPIKGLMEQRLRQCKEIVGEETGA